MSAQKNSTALERRSPADIESPITGAEMETLWRLAKGLAESGFFKDAKAAGQAFGKLVFGRDLGLSATQAMSEIHIIEGKPEMSANLQAAKVKASGKYDYRVLGLTNTACSIEFGEGHAPKRDPETAEWLPWPDALGVSEFTAADAKTADLSGKANHRRYPRNMLFARAMSNGVAWYCPDVMNGIRVYAEGEVREVIDVDAESLPDAEPVEDAPVSDEASPLLDDETRMELAQAIEAAGVPLDLILSAVGVDSLEEIRESHTLAVSQAIAAKVARVGASS